jgi:hypothetical protein
MRMSDNSIIDDGRLPALDDPCGGIFTFNDLIQCGETARDSDTSNLPNSLGSYQALRDLAEHILDPVIDCFGSIELTYGFCSAALRRQTPGRIAPELDQHAAHETNRTGKLICKRLGAAADFLVRDQDMLAVAQWVVENTPFDRLYFYGKDRPIHVSYGPEKKKEAYELVLTRNGRRVPRKLVFDLVGDGS